MMRGWIVRAIRDLDRNNAFDKRRQTSSDKIGERTGIALLRYAVSLFDRCNETLNGLFTAEELLRIASACERTGWDFMPDEWTARQLEEAARRGTVPQWVENPNGGYAAVYKPRERRS